MLPVNPMAPLLLAAAALLALSGCVSPPPGFGMRVSIASEPAGADVYIDGSHTGFATPCKITLPRKEQILELRLDGYETTQRALRPESAGTSVQWAEMNVYLTYWAWPLWLNWEDLVRIYEMERYLAPNRIFVRLRRAADRVALSSEP